MLKLKSSIAASLRLLTTAISLRGFVRREDGATAVEFALVSLPFFALIVALFEVGFAFLAQQVLQTATTESARLIMTGQAQTQGMNATQFQQNVCANVTILSCSNIYVNVQKFSTFTGVSQLNPIQNGNFNSNLMNYTTGSPGDIVLVQVFYQLPVVTAPLGFNIANMSSNTRLLVATAVFRNEPY